MIMNNRYFGLNPYQQEDLRSLILYYKKFDGFTEVKMNCIDRLIAKEHVYGQNRMFIFGLWILCGLFIPIWIPLSSLLNRIIYNFDLCSFLSFTICIIIGIVFQVIYTLSCDKIDYNALIKKIQQINIFEIMTKGE